MKSPEKGTKSRQSFRAELGVAKELCMTLGQLRREMTYEAALDLVRLLRIRNDEQKRP